jgi:Tfp pilus assembly protein PilV
MQRLNQQKHSLESSRHSGFTLIETLFSILIFSAALISLLAISSKGISATNEVKNETMAYYLAQEGLEVVRNIRDNNFLAIQSGGSGAWTDGFLNNPDCSTTPCHVVYTAGSVPTLAQNSGQLSNEIYFNAGQYANTGTEDTGFSRDITVAVGAGQDEYIITSTVNWQAKAIKKTVTLQTFLKKWQ